MRLRQLLGICPRRPRTIAGAQPAPQVLGQISGCNEVLDGCERDSFFIEFGTRVCALLPKEGKCPHLRRLSRKSREQIVRNLPRSIELLILRLVAFIRLILLAHEIIAQKFFHTQLDLSRRKFPPQLRHALTAVLTQMSIDGMDARIHKDGVPLIPILRRCIDRKNSETALARHKETHDLRHRTKVKVRQLLCGGKKLGGKPCLLIHRIDDFLQRMLSIPRCIIGAHTGDEPLLAHAAERDEDTPPCRDLRKPLRQEIGELLSDALDRNVDIDIRNGHMFTFFTKKAVTRMRSCNSSFPYTTTTRQSPPDSQGSPCRPDTQGRYRYLPPAPSPALPQHYTLRLSAHRTVRHRPLTP